MYRLLRPLLFRLDAERAHEFTLESLAFLSRHPGLLRLSSWLWRTDDPRLETEVLGLRFSNPLLLAAGMDKNGVAVPAWAALGFGGAELGTVTMLPQEGNPQPRLFRLPADGGIINRMGFNNDGAEAVARRLSSLGSAADPEAARPARLTVGINVGKSRVRTLEEAGDDYRASLQLLWPHADYLVLNVSSPNTPGLRQLQEHGRLSELLAVTSELQLLGRKPVLLKIAPDLSEEALADICQLAGQYDLAGLVATNTTISRDGLREDPDEQGGLSGRPLSARSLAVLRFIRARTDLPLISAGGIWTVQDAIDRLRAGASLLQVYTSFIYKGPGFTGRLLRGLLREVEREGVASVSDLVGLDA